jgi:urease accessory protein UreF
MEQQFKERSLRKNITFLKTHWALLVEEHQQTGKTISKIINELISQQLSPEARKQSESNGFTNIR